MALINAYFDNLSVTLQILTFRPTLFEAFSVFLLLLEQKFVNLKGF